MPVALRERLGVPISSAAAEELVWEQHFSPYELEFLKNHRVGFVSLLPGTCYIEMGRAVVRVGCDAEGRGVAGGRAAAL